MQPIRTSACAVRGEWGEECPNEECPTKSARRSCPLASCNLSGYTKQLHAPKGRFLTAVHRCCSVKGVVLSAPAKMDRGRAGRVLKRQARRAWVQSSEFIRAYNSKPTKLALQAMHWACPSRPTRTCAAWSPPSC